MADVSSSIPSVTSSSSTQAPSQASAPSSSPAVSISQSDSGPGFLGSSGPDTSNPALRHLAEVDAKFSGDDAPLTDDNVTSGNDPAPEQPVADAPEPSPFTEDDFRGAAELGMTPDEVKAFGHPARFRAMAERFAEIGARNALRTMQQQRGEAPMPSRDGQPTPGAFKFKFEDKDGEAPWDKEFTGQLQSFSEQTFGQLSEMRNAVIRTIQELDQLKALGDDLKRRDGEADEREFDTWVDSLGPGYEELLGKGPTSAFQQADAKRLNRQAIRDLSAMLEQGYRSNRQTPPTKAELRKMALNAKFAEKLKTIAARELKGQLDQRSRQSVARATDRDNRTDMPPEKRAERAVAKLLAQLG